MMKGGFDSMTNDETLRVLAILKAAYPSSYNGMTKREANGTVAVWCIQFSDIPVDIVLMAVQKLISTNKFPPSISEVKSKIGSLYWEAQGMLNSYPTSECISEEEKMQYRRICDLTQDFRMKNSGEPSLHQMLEGGHLLQLGSGGE
jgi:hypothetical protein